MMKAAPSSCHRAVLPRRRSAFHNLGGALPNVLVLPIKAIGAMGLSLRSAPTASTSDKAKRGGKLMTKA